MSEARHNSAIVDQFTRQAEVFNVAASLTNEQALRNIVAATQAGTDDTVLDVACGGGVVLCAFAPHVKHATGIDMTPAMLNFGRGLAAKKGLANVTFKQGGRQVGLEWSVAGFGDFSGNANETDMLIQ